MGTLAILRVDVIDGAREAWERIQNHRFMTCWFVFLGIGTASLGLFLANIILLNPDLSSSEFAVRPETVLFGAFLLLFGKSLIDAHYRAVENHELVFILTQPVTVRQVVWSKLLGVLVSNLALAGVAVVVMGFTYSLYVLSPSGNNLVFTLPWQYLADAVILAAAAAPVGFVYAVISGLRTWHRYALGVPFGGLFLGLNFVLRESSWGLDLTLLALLPVTGLCFASVLLAEPFYLAAWSHQTGGKEALPVQRFVRARDWRFPLLAPFVDLRTRTLMRKELVLNIQRKEIVGNLLAVVGIGILLFYVHGRLVASRDISPTVQRLAMPVIIALGVYLAATLQCALIGLGSLGKEGRKFWILKSLPVHPVRIFTAKALSILLFTPLTVLAVGLPIPIYLHYPPEWILFFALTVVLLSVAFTGVGVWAGSMWPSFDESRGGTPDSMSMYVVSMACLVLAVALIAPPGFYLGGIPRGSLPANSENGALAMAAAFCAAFVILALGILRGARRYEQLEGPAGMASADAGR